MPHTVILSLSTTFVAAPLITGSSLCSILIFGFAHRERSSQKSDARQTAPGHSNLTKL
ncbi:hypothetical protein ABIF07_003567 [Bradyrhizobium elkanii]|nr:hypothetical protein [Bradyrhizobium elkanii]